MPHVTCFIQLCHSSACRPQIENATTQVHAVAFYGTDAEMMLLYCEKTCDRLIVYAAMNEVTWQHVLAWEALHAGECANPQLLRFTGRPDELRYKSIGE